MSSMVPPFVAQVCAFNGAWIVGKAANPEFEKEIRDFDVIVPFHEWHKVAGFIPKNAVPNTFGGWKFNASIFGGDLVSVDMWPGDLAWFMAQPRTVHVWNPHLNARFTKQ